MDFICNLDKKNVEAFDSFMVSTIITYNRKTAKWAQFDKLDEVKNNKIQLL